MKTFWLLYNSESKTVDKRNVFHYIWHFCSPWDCLSYGGYGF